MVELPEQRLERDFMIITFGLPDRGFQTNLPARFWYRAPGGTTDQPADVHVLSLLDRDTRAVVRSWSLKKSAAAS
jgi:hypothetical protein